MGTPFSNRELIRRIRWYVSVRWFYIIAIGVPGNIALALSSSSMHDQIKINIGFLIVIALINGLFMAATYVHVRMSGFYELLSVFQIVFDIVTMTVLFEFNSGIETPLAMLYCIPILMSGVLLDKKAVYITGFSIVAIFVTFSVLDITNVIKPGNIDAPILHSEPSSFVPTVVTVAMTLVAITFIADFVAQFVRKSTWLEHELAGNQSEMAKTNEILSLLPSALVVVDENGKITQVNRAFERMMLWNEDRAIGKQAASVLKMVTKNKKPVHSLERTLRAVLRRKQLPLQTVPYYLDSHFLRRKNGTLFRYGAQISSIIASGRLVGAMIVIDERTDEPSTDA